MARFVSCFLFRQDEWSEYSSSLKKKKKGVGGWVRGIESYSLEEWEVVARDFVDMYVIHPPTHPPTHSPTYKTGCRSSHPPTNPPHPAAHSNRLVLLYLLTHPPTHPPSPGTAMGATTSPSASFLDGRMKV